MVMSVTALPIVVLVGTTFAFTRWALDSDEDCDSDDEMLKEGGHSEEIPLAEGPSFAAQPIVELARERIHRMPHWVVDLRKTLDKPAMFVVGCGLKDRASLGADPQG